MAEDRQARLRSLPDRSGTILDVVDVRPVHSSAGDLVSRRDVEPR